MYFVVQYRARKENNNLRSTYHAAHVEFRRGHGSRVLLSGPLLSIEGGDPVGSLFIVAADSFATATDLAARDPFCLHGVYEVVSVSPFKPTVVNPPLAE